jgi:hypothetical protein
VIRRQTREGEEPVAGFLQTTGDGAVLDPPFVDERSLRAATSSRVAEIMWL